MSRRRHVQRLLGFRDGAPWADVTAIDVLDPNAWDWPVGSEAATVAFATARAVPRSLSRGWEIRTRCWLPAHASNWRSEEILHPAIIG
jgi:hypothetical protein